MIKLKRAYEPALPTEGRRFLVERLELAADSMRWLPTRSTAPADAGRCHVTCPSPQTADA